VSSKRTGGGETPTALDVGRAPTQSVSDLLFGNQEGLVCEGGLHSSSMSARQKRFREGRGGGKRTSLCNTLFIQIQSVFVLKHSVTVSQDPHNEIPQTFLKLAGGNGRYWSITMLTILTLQQPLSSFIE
jgi:hypothetical protein